ncbi:MAG: nitrophenyl compound nitroreductase subunit ArsF family protein [Terracidiphilus sp.]
MNAKTFFSAALLLFVAACVFFFVRGPAGQKPVLIQQGAGDAGTASVAEALDAEPFPGNTRVVVYFFHGHHQCPSCRHLEAVSESAIADGFPAAMRRGVIEWRAVDIEDAANRHFASEYQVYWSSLVLVKVAAGKPVAYKNLEYAWQIQQDNAALENYVQAEVRACLGAS